MGAIATAGGVAKATLYNHFRTKPDVWAALIDREVRRIAGEVCALGDPAQALDVAATRVGSLAAVRALAESEPESLVPLLTPAQSGPWQPAREAVALVLLREPGDPLVDLVLRWLVSQLLAPAEPSVRAAGAAALARAAAGAAAPTGASGTGSSRSGEVERPDQGVATPAGAG